MESETRRGERREGGMERGGEKEERDGEEGRERDIEYNYKDFIICGLTLSRVPHL